MTEKSRVLWVSLILLAVAALVAAGCSDNDQEREILPKNIAVQKAQLRIAMESTANNIDTLMNAIQQRAANSVESINADVEQKVDSLKKWKDEINSRLGSLENVTTKNWDAFEAETRGYIDRVNEKLNEMKP